MNAGGELTGRVARELAAERHERAVHMLDATAMIRVLRGSPAILTELERDAVIVLADSDGVDRRIVAEGLGVKKNTLDRMILDRRRRMGGLTRDLQAAAMLRPAAELVAAVGAGDASAVAAVLTPMDRQRLAALAVVLAAAVSDPSILPVAGQCDTGMPTFDDAGV